MVVDVDVFAQRHLTGTVNAHWRRQVSAILDLAVKELVFKLHQPLLSSRISLPQLLAEVVATINFAVDLTLVVGIPNVNVFALVEAVKDGHYFFPSAIPVARPGCSGP